MNWAQTYIKDTIKDVLYAPAVMASISLILPLLRNPAALDEANRQGFAYVISQIGYYAEIESLLLPKDMKPGLRADLTTRVIDLYKLIIEFQIRSVMRFYRIQRVSLMARVRVSPLPDRRNPKKAAPPRSSLRNCGRVSPAQPGWAPPRARTSQWRRRIRGGPPWPEYHVRTPLAGFGRPAGDKRPT